MISSSAIFAHARRCLNALPVHEWLVMLRLHSAPGPQTLSELSDCPRYRSAVNGLISLGFVEPRKVKRLTLFRLTPKGLDFLQLPTAFHHE